MQEVKNTLTAVLHGTILLLVLIRYHIAGLIRLYMRLLCKTNSWESSQRHWRCVAYSSTNWVNPCKWAVAASVQERTNNHQYWIRLSADAQCETQQHSRHTLNSNSPTSLEYTRIVVASPHCLSSHRLWFFSAFCYRQLTYQTQNHAVLAFPVSYVPSWMSSTSLHSLV